MKHQPTRRRTALVGFAVLAGVVTLCLVLPMVLVQGGVGLWALLALGVAATAALASRAVWAALDDGPSHSRR